jgi:hypothetical protein
MPRGHVDPCTHLNPTPSIPAHSQAVAIGGFEDTLLGVCLEHGASQGHHFQELQNAATQSLAAASRGTVEGAHGVAEVYTVGPGQCGERLWTTSLIFPIADIVKAAGGGTTHLTTLSLPDGQELEVKEGLVSDVLKLACAGRVVLKIA